MLSSKIRTRNRTNHSNNKKDTTNKLGLTKDILDVVLKVSVVLLALPAFAIFNYLRAIHRIDLFVPAVLSAAGLAALLQASFFVFAAFIAGFAAPSWFAALMVQTYPKAPETPTVLRFADFDRRGNGILVFSMGLLRSEQTLVGVVAIHAIGNWSCRRSVCARVSESAWLPDTHTGRTIQLATAASVDIGKADGCGSRRRVRHRNHSPICFAYRQSIQDLDGRTARVYYRRHCNVF